MNPTTLTRHWFAQFILAGVLASSVAGQDGPRVRDAVRHYKQKHDVEIVKELWQLLEIPNLASDSVNIRRNAERLVQMLDRRGIGSQLLESAGSPPAVYGYLAVPGATHTIVFYAHYDGQPVDTLQWTSAPWSPTLRDKALSAGGKVLSLPTDRGTVGSEWRLYARSASDDKSPIIAFLSALDALKEAGIPPSVNVKLFLEGEEEAGSPHLSAMLTKYRDLLTADLWIFGDGPVHQSRRQQITFGVRGTLGLELTAFGPARALHSGHYGNWAPNPLVLIANLLASMRDNDGRILIDHFYDDVRPVTATERQAIAAAPSPDSALRAELLLGWSEANNAAILDRIMLPALNLRGISGGGVGSQAANAIPTVARASIDFRLVPRQTPARVRQLVEAHLRKHDFYIVHAEPTGSERLLHRRVLRLDWEEGYAASRTDMSLPASRAVIRAVELGIDGKVIVLPTLGGSAPLNQIESVLRTPLITVPIVNHDNNQHAANENLRLQNLFDGMQVYAAILAHLGLLWNRLDP